LFSMIGRAVSAIAAVMMITLLVRRFLVGPEAEGLFTLFAVMFFFIGLALFGIGLLGEYVGRIYAQVRERPRYIVEAVLEAHDEDATALLPAPPAAPAAITPAHVVTGQ
jgi:undecaprenyl-phosphate 4-deoxy-4-formamido-L-arabinose transferase